ncbi:hypothetical protein EHS25_002437 [Saitozyma podzolica]|uniref:Uncharacterized protein n=1 Tax=Saitozyma podzolica TaxID=1890683 RepID=A0A427YDU6_9TREE|nr:hypothetical protein EHS25_002437 [Saitozyma podzolica]
MPIIRFPSSFATAPSQGLGSAASQYDQAPQLTPPSFQGAKRPPSPPSPSLRPTQTPDPRSIHLQHLYARQRQSTPVVPQDPFDAPVPNETYAAEDGNEGQIGGAGGGMGVEGWRVVRRGRRWMRNEE